MVAARRVVRGNGCSHVTWGQNGSLHSTGLICTRYQQAALSQIQLRDAEAGQAQSSGANTLILSDITILVRLQLLTVRYDTF